MGTDIWINVERKSRRYKRYKYGKEYFFVGRYYIMFSFLASARSEFEALYPPRGLPEDMSKTTLRKYKEGESDYHTCSWLTTSEFRECIDHAKKAAEELKIKFSPQFDPRPDYERIYQYMKEGDEAGEPSRIVFWFDN